MNSRNCIFGVLIIVFIVYIGGCRRAGAWLVKDDERVHADVIVILMGSVSDRLLQAIDLYNEKLADKIIFVETPNDSYNELKERGADFVSYTRQMRDAAIALGIPSDKIIILPGGAQSTQQEALIIKDYILNKPEVDTLMLVTSSPHIRRAKKIFKYVLNKTKQPVCLLCSPNPYTKFNAEKWWKNKDDIETVLLEYLKLMNFILFDRRELVQKQYSH